MHLMIKINKMLKILITKVNGKNIILHTFKRYKATLHVWITLILYSSCNMALHLVVMSTAEMLSFNSKVVQYTYMYIYLKYSYS